MALYWRYTGSSAYNFMDRNLICTKQEPKTQSDSRYWFHPDSTIIGEAKEKDFPYAPYCLWECPHCKFKFLAFNFKPEQNGVQYNQKVIPIPHKPSK